MSVVDRHERLRRALAPEFTGAVVARPIHVQYLSGWSPPPRWPSYLVLGPTRAILVAPGQPTRPDPAVTPLPYVAYSHSVPAEPLANAEEALLVALAEAGLEGAAVALEDDWLPARLAASPGQRARLGTLGDHGRRWLGILAEEHRREVEE